MPSPSLPFQSVSVRRTRFLTSTLFTSFCILTWFRTLQTLQDKHLKHQRRYCPIMPVVLKLGLEQCILLTEQVASTRKLLNIHSLLSLGQMKSRAETILHADDFSWACLRLCVKFTSFWILMCVFCWFFRCISEQILCSFFSTVCPMHS